MQDLMKRGSRGRGAALPALPAMLLALLLPAGPAVAAGPDAVAAARAELIALIATHPPDQPVSPQFDARVKAAAAVLEAAAGSPPDIKADPARVDGVWVCLYDTRDLLSSAGMRIMSGGYYPDAKIPARGTLQVLAPAGNYYRNVVMLAAGPERIPVIYDATARLSFDEAANNVFRVKFERLAFLPADARYSEAQVREALGLPPDAALVIDVPPGPSSPSEVSYLDADLRINRGKTYVAVLRRLNTATAPARP